MKINRKFKLKHFWNTIYGVIFVLLLIIAGTVALSMFDIPGGIKFYNVQSGSMEPTIKTGSLIISKPFDSYQIGDIITFKSAKDKDIKNPKVTTTHRISEIKNNEDKVEYITKGDANDVVDVEPVSKDLIIGKSFFYIPYLGYPISFAKTKEGLIVLIVIPVTLIIYSEILTIKKEAVRLYKESKKRKLTKMEKIEEEIGEEEIKIEKGLKKFFKKIFKKKKK